MSSLPPPPVPATTETGSPGRGCGKKALVGCGVVALVLAACFLGFILYARSKPEFITDFVMKQIESHYAADVTEGDKTELRAAYADFRKALRERRVSKEPLDRMRATLVSGGTSNEIHRDQVRELIALFRRNAGSPPGQEAASPAPAPSPPPTP